MRKTFELIFTITFFVVTTQAQDKPAPMPEVGKPMPAFILPKVTHYDKPQLTSDDMLGKWLFLDFWFSGCSTCIVNMPKYNEIQGEYRDKLNWVLVGVNSQPAGRPQVIERVFEKFRVLRGLELISAYDSVLSKKWGIHSMPHIFVIDPKGVVRYITDGRDLTLDKVEQITSGRDVQLFGSVDFVETPKGQDTTRQFVFYSSSIGKWSGGPQTMYELDQFIANQSNKAYAAGFPMKMVPLFWLYNTAYFGRCYLKNLDGADYEEYVSVAGAGNAGSKSLRFRL
ncbi:MAG: TlpA disulfide reductase family protein [Chryseolinea sp.]